MESKEFTEPQPEDRRANVGAGLESQAPPDYFERESAASPAKKNGAKTEDAGEDFEDKYLQENVSASSASKINSPDAELAAKQENQSPKYQEPLSQNVTSNSQPNPEAEAEEVK